MHVQMYTVDLMQPSSIIYIWRERDLCLLIISEQRQQTCENQVRKIIVFLINNATYEETLIIARMSGGNEQKGSRSRPTTEKRQKSD